MARNDEIYIARERLPLNDNLIGMLSYIQVSGTH